MYLVALNIGMKHLIKRWVIPGDVHRQHELPKIAAAILLGWELTDQAQEWQSTGAWWLTTDDRYDPDSDTLEITLWAYCDLWTAEVWQILHVL
jgi:hypothetical protein